VLNIQIQSIEDYESVCLAPAPKPSPTGGFEFRWGDDQVLVAHVYTIALTGLTVGLCEVTDKTIDEWTYRFDEWQDTFGPLLRLGDGRGIRIGRADFERYKGLRINATTMTRRQFNKHLRECALQELRSNAAQSD
jgi:hypothetical protein